MNRGSIDQADSRLKELVSGYQSRGYQVVTRPLPADLPDFAKDFKVEFIARRGDEKVFVVAKANRSALEADEDVLRYAETIEQQSGWRLDLAILESEQQPDAEVVNASEPSDEDVRQSLKDVEQILRSGFVREAMISAWGALEAAMRKRLQTDGQKSVRESSPRTMLNELYSNGILETSEFRHLEGLFHARNAIVHGFTTPIVPGGVEFLIRTTRTLLDESLAAKRSA